MKLVYSTSTNNAYLLSVGLTIMKPKRRLNRGILEYVSQIHEDISYGITGSVKLFPSSV